MQKRNKLEKKYLQVGCVAGVYVCACSVSYTHLDVYKRQVLIIVLYIIFNCVLFDLC